MTWCNKVTKCNEAQPICTLWTSHNNEIIHKQKDNEVKSHDYNNHFKKKKYIQ